MSITAQVREILNEDPRSYYEIARAAGVHVSSLTRYADGGAPSSRVLDAVAEILELTVVNTETETNDG
jgi:hypothetical protein